MTDLGRHLTSDDDGVRHVVLDRQDEEPGRWTVLVWRRDDDIMSAPARRVTAFERRTVWGEPGNLLGFGEPRRAWAVVVDRDEVAQVQIGGGRCPIVGVDAEAETA